MEPYYISLLNPEYNLWKPHKRSILRGKIFCPKDIMKKIKKSRRSHYILDIPNVGKYHTRNLRDLAKKLGIPDVLKINGKYREISVFKREEKEIPKEELVSFLKLKEYVDNFEKIS